MRTIGALLRDERGQSFVEWLGGSVVMLALVLLIFALRPSLAGQLRCAVGGQVDRILSIDATGGCKPSNAPLRLPRNPPHVRLPGAQAAQAAQDRADRRALR
jgi:hypothetical protein